MFASSGIAMVGPRSKERRQQDEEQEVAHRSSHRHDAGGRCHREHLGLRRDPAAGDPIGDPEAWPGAIDAWLGKMQLTDWGDGAVSDASTAVVEVGRDAYCHWLPALPGGGHADADGTNVDNQFDGVQ